MARSEEVRKKWVIKKLGLIYSYRQDAFDKLKLQASKLETDENPNSLTHLLQMSDTISGYCFM